MKSPWLQVTVVFSVPTDGHYFELYGVQHKVILADISLTQRVQNYGYFLYWIAPLFLIFNFIGKLISEKESIILYLRNRFPFYFFFRYSVPDFLIIIAKKYYSYGRLISWLLQLIFFPAKKLENRKYFVTMGTYIKIKYDANSMSPFFANWIGHGKPDSARLAHQAYHA